MLPADFFTSYPVLKFIDLSYSKLSKVADFTFKMPTLLELNLRGNELLLLTQFMFSGAVNLRAIDFSSNMIQSIQAETFTSLRSLAVINLSHNALHNKSFSGDGSMFIDYMPSLRELDLSFNSIEMDDEVLAYDAFSGLPALEALNLSYNELTIDFGAFASNGNLKTLDLSFNNFTYFDLNYLLSVSSLENLYLHGNYIAYASQIDLADIRSVFPNIKSIGIASNAFACETLAQIIRSMDKAKIQLVPHGTFVKTSRNLRGIKCT